MLQASARSLINFTTMGARRRLDFSNVTDLPLAKRVRRVERIASRSRASRTEMKCISYNNSVTVPAVFEGAKGFNLLNILNISQGDLITNRSGNKIKVWRVEIRGIMSTVLDGYLLQLHGNPALSEADFSDSKGCFLLPDRNNTVATEWAYFSPSGVGSATPTATYANFRLVRKFRGMEVRYLGTNTTAVDNGLNVVCLNSTTTVGILDYNVRVWFTDA